MKKQFSILLFLFAFNGFSQSLEKLKTDTKKLYEANYVMDFDAMLHYSYPKIAESNGEKEAKLNELELHYESGEYKLRLQLEKVPFLFGAIKDLAGKKFCVITFRNPVRYTYYETKLTDTMIAKKKAWLQEINQNQQVTFEPKRNSFNVVKTTTYVAVIDENTNNEWKFFNFDIMSERDYFENNFKDAKKELGL